MHLHAEGFIILGNSGTARRFREGISKSALWYLGPSGLREVSISARLADPPFYFSPHISRSLASTQVVEETATVGAGAPICERAGVGKTAGTDFRNWHETCKAGISQLPKRVSSTNVFFWGSMLLCKATFPGFGLDFRMTVHRKSRLAELGKMMCAERNPGVATHSFQSLTCTNSVFLGCCLGPPVVPFYPLGFPC